LASPPRTALAGSASRIICAGVREGRRRPTVRRGRTGALQPAPSGNVSAGVRALPGRSQRAACGAQDHPAERTRARQPLQVARERPPGAVVPLVAEPSFKRGGINLARKSRNHPRHDQEAEGATVGELLADLDRRYPGMRFRMIDEQDAIRPHVRIFVNREQVWGLEAPLRPSDEVQILQALSGG
jgi:molybdopterin synthase sulfur carrier subunit